MEFHYVMLMNYITLTELCYIMLTLSTPYATIVALSHLVQKVPSLELLHATEFSMRLV